MVIAVPNGLCGQAEKAEAVGRQPELDLFLATSVIVGGLNVGHAAKGGCEEAVVGIVDAAGIGPGNVVD